MNDNNQDLVSLQDAWIKAKADEDRAKESRLLIENLILEAVGYTEGDANFKTWTDKLKITVTRKEEYDNEKLKEIINPVNLFDGSLPFRLKIEPDAKKMMEFKIRYAQFYNDKLLPIRTEKFSKPSFSINAKKGE